MSETTWPSFAALLLAHTEGRHAFTHPECGACEVALQRCDSCGWFHGGHSANCAHFDYDAAQRKTGPTA